MKTKDPKIIIPVIRKLYPKMMADMIAGVQPMQGSTGSIFKLNVNDSLINPWSEWRRTTSLWPRKSINGKWILGRINKRGRAVWDGPMQGRARRLREFATNKELFASILKGDV